MKKAIFFDSWGWIAVADSKDPYHETAKPFYQEYLSGGGIPITTDYILDEVLTVLRRRLTHEVVVKFGEGIFTSFVIMSEFKIREVFTGDEHFEKVNLNFKRVPID
jgi:predicted nucleic acid-binding protein